MRERFNSRMQGDGVELQVYEWPGEGRPVFLAHATGFHARCWDQVVERLPGRHIYAIDMRGHGLSEKPAPPYDWLSFGRDIAAVVRQLGLRGAVGVGHSKGGFAVVGAAAEEPDAFAALLLIDPVIFAPEFYARPGRREPHFAARRRARWASKDEMFESFRGRAPFAAWDPAVLRDYVEHGLLPAADGEGFELACPPAIEAAVYDGNMSGRRIHDQVPAIAVPVRVLRAQARGDDPRDMSGSPTAPALASWFPRGEDVPVPQYTHFIPMEDPAFVAHQVEHMAAAAGGWRV